MNQQSIPDPAAASVEKPITMNGKHRKSDQDAMIDKFVALVALDPRIPDTRHVEKMGVTYRTLMRWRKTSYFAKRLKEIHDRSFSEKCMDIQKRRELLAEIAMDEKGNGNARVKAIVADHELSGDGASKKNKKNEAMLAFIGLWGQHNHELPGTYMDKIGMGPTKNEPKRITRGD